MDMCHTKIASGPKNHDHTLKINYLFNAPNTLTMDNHPVLYQVSRCLAVYVFVRWFSGANGLNVSVFLCSKILNYCTYYYSWIAHQLDIWTPLGRRQN